MREYIVYRHGWNDANQSRDHGMPEKMPVLRLRAAGPDEACGAARDQVTLHQGQTLSAEPADVIDAEVNNLDLKAEALSSGAGLERGGDE